MDTRLSALCIGLERFGTDASNVTMAPCTVVEGFNVVGHVSARQLAILVDVFLDPLFLQARKEGLSDCIVLAVAAPAHARLKPIRSTEAPPVIAAILGSLLGVDDGALRASASHGHHDGVQDEFAAQACAGGPADNQSREQIHHDCQIQPTLPGANVRDISDPDLVRADDVEISLDQIGRDDSGFATGVAPSSVAMSQGAIGGAPANGMNTPWPYSCPTASSSVAMKSPKTENNAPTLFVAVHAV